MFPRAALCLAVCAFPCIAGWFDTPIGIDLNALPSFPLTKVRSGTLKVGEIIKFDGITALAALGEVKLMGRAPTGTPWEAHLCPSCFDDVWRADLDGNGTQDYVFYGLGPFFNGRTTPAASLTFLLLDKQGLPVPFSTSVYDEDSGIAIKRVVDLNRDGKAEVLISTYDENASARNFGPGCSGHWTTQAYRFEAFGAEEVSGRLGNMAFPVVHAWTDPGCQPGQEPVKRAEPPSIFERGTSVARQVSTGLIRTDGDYAGYQIDPREGCKAIAQPRMVVYNQKRMRRIAFENLMNDFKDRLMAEIFKAHVAVTLRGLDHWMGNGDCSVNLLWANDRP